MSSDVAFWGKKIDKEEGFLEGLEETASLVSINEKKTTCRCRQEEMTPVLQGQQASDSLTDSSSLSFIPLLSLAFQDWRDEKEPLTLGVASIAADWLVMVLER